MAENGDPISRGSERGVYRGGMGTLRRGYRESRAGRGRKYYSRGKLPLNSLIISPILNITDIFRLRFRNRSTFAVCRDRDTVCCHHDTALEIKVLRLDRGIEHFQDFLTIGFPRSLSRSPHR